MSCAAVQALRTRPLTTLAQAMGAQDVVSDIKGIRHRQRRADSAEQPAKSGLKPRRPPNRRRHTGAARPAADPKVPTS
jgi:hypothetical protein